MAADRGYIERGTASRERIRGLTERLTEDDLRRRVDADWTVAALLAHVGFWDRFVVAEWELALREGLAVPPRWERGHTDMVNAASIDEWHALDGRAAVGLAVRSAERHDAYVAALDDRHVEAATAEGRANLLDRSRHRNEHLDAIERLIGSDGPG